MEWIIALFVLGTVFIFFEALVPGIILGLIGTALFLAGTIVAFAQYGFVGGSVAGIIAIVIVAFTFWLEFKVLPKTNLGARFFHTEANTAASQGAVAPDDVIGKLGEALTPLAPTGVVLIDGRRYEAQSSSGFMEKSARLKVVAKDAFKLTVVRA